MILRFLLLCLPVALCTGDDLDFPGCPGRDRCSDIPEVSDFLARNCECDSDCVDFGDCCEDHPRDDARQRKNYSDRPMKCVEFDTGPSNMGVYMVVDCPEGTEPNLKAKCEKGNYNPITILPSGTTFLNNHCALCNAHDTPMARREFKFSDLFTLLNTSEVARRDPKFKLRDLLVSKYSKVGKRDLPPYLEGLRLCRPYLSECPHEWSDERVREACHGGYEAAVYGSRRAYRNPHCALCNGEDLRTLVCNPSELEMGRRKEFSFAHLFDVSGEGDVGRVVLKCTKDQVFDPVSKTCRNLVCAIPGYVRRNRKCVKKSSLEE